MRSGRASSAAEPGPAPAALADLHALLRRPTVSGDPARAGDVRACAAWLAGRLRRAGFSRVAVLAGRRHPAVVAHRPARPGHATVLLYAHYDVQPPGARSAWRSDPFVPVRRGDDVVARGASDDKGQLLAQLLGAERALRAGVGVGVAMLLDGEEEIGSPSLPDVLARVLPAVRPDAAVVSDTRMLGPGRPALTVGLRGSLALELRIAGPPRELHAGQFGGAVRNPAEMLCAVLAGLHDATGRIAVPGLYAAVRPLPRELPPPRSDAEILAEAGVRRGCGEPGRSAYERTVARPALTVNGLVAGHPGPGAKAIIPASASATLSLRLVPDQRPDRVEELVRARIAALVGPGLRWSLERRGASLPVLLDRDDPVHRAAATACRQVWGRGPVALRSGGSIGVVEQLAVRHRVPTALLGFALPDDGAHGPREKFHLPHLELGARTIAALLGEMGAVRPRAAAAARSPRSHGPARSRSPRSRRAPARTRTG